MSVYPLGLVRYKQFCSRFRQFCSRFRAHSLLRQHLYTSKMQY